MTATEALREWLRIWCDWMMGEDPDRGEQDIMLSREDWEVIDALVEETKRLVGGNPEGKGPGA